MAQSTDPMMISQDGQRRTAPPPGLQSGDGKDGHENVSMFSKAKNKAKKLRDKVKDTYKGQHDRPSDNKEEEEEQEEEEETAEDEYREKPDENVEDVTKGMAGLGGLGTAKKDDRANQGSEKVNKTTLADILGKNDDAMSTEENRKKSEGPDDELLHKGGMLTEAKENPKESLFSFNETSQGRGKRGDDILPTQKEENETDVGTPSIPQRVAQAMPGATGGIIGLGKGNKQEEESGEEKPNPSKIFDKPPLGLKEAPKPLEEEFQSLQEKCNKDPQSDVGEGTELSSNEKPNEGVKSSVPVDTKKVPVLFQELKDSFTSDQGKKDGIVPEEQSRENQDYLTSDQGKKDGIVPEEQSWEKQDSLIYDQGKKDDIVPEEQSWEKQDSLTSDQGKKENDIVPEEQSRAGRIKMKECTAKEKQKEAKVMLKNYMLPRMPLHRSLDMVRYQLRRKLLLKNQKEKTNRKVPRLERKRLKKLNPVTL